ncbi:uncharacterized protein LOC135617574 isoform X3 [Musa acuminata AAA Group]|uniref:uncharacterized protein LOC108952340 isoform X3 n=1 Tax=Musa acuminata AAA Group TaxID=214697 RepID=UPI0031D3BFB0
MKRRSCRMEQSTHLPHVFLHQRHVTLFVGPDEHVAHARLLVDGAGGAQVASTVVHAVPRPNLGGTRVKKSCALVVDEIDGKLALRRSPMHDKKEKHCFQQKTTYQQADGMPSLSRFTCSFKCMEFGAFTDLMSRLYLLAVGVGVGSLCWLASSPWHKGLCSKRWDAYDEDGRQLHHVCRINYDNQKTQSKNTGVKFDERLRVRRIVGDDDGTNREEIGNLLEVRRRDRRRFTEITEESRLLIKVITSSGACLDPVGRSSSESSPEQDLTLAVDKLLRMCFVM